MTASRYLLLTTFAAFLAAAPLAAQTTHTVIVRDFAFDPATLVIERGDTVVWENEQGVHNVNGTTGTFPGNPEGFGNAPAGPPWTYEFTFTTEGAYEYQCDVHPVMMRGAVTVTAPLAAEDDLPPGAALTDPSPNPFRGALSFSLTLPEPEPVRVAVYDALGREVAVLYEGAFPAGTPVPIEWKPAAARSGVYTVRVEGATFRAVRKVVRVR